MTGLPDTPPWLRAAGAWPPVTAPRWLYSYIAAAVVLIAAAGALMALDVNRPLFLTLNEAGTALPAWAWQWITFLGDTHTAVVVAFLFGLRWPQIFWATVFAAIIGTLATHGGKELFGLSRPPGVLDTDTFRVIGKAYRNNAFPSGHTLTAFTLAGAVTPFLRHWGWRTLLLGGAGVVGLSRIMVGIHWPADVLAGAGCGLLAGLLGVAAARRWPAGMRPRVHMALAAIFTAAAVALFWHDGRYPAAIHLARPLSVIAVAAGLAFYWWPLLRIRR